MKKNGRSIKLCFLEISPKGPLSIHKDIVNSDLVSFYFVTHDKRVANSLGFFKGETWAENRNHLYQLVPKRYDYYCFIDYDVELKSLSDKSVVEQIFDDLDRFWPAVLVPTNINSETESKNVEANYKSGLFANTQIKIYHKSILDYILPLPTKFGGFWDASSISNILEIPLKERVIATPKLTNKSLFSAPYKHNKDVEYGFSSMQKAYEWIYPAIKNKEPTKIVDLKDKYMFIRDRVEIRKAGKNVNYSNFEEIENYFNLSHEMFNNFTIIRNDKL